jgi:hypothetical protein
MPRSARDDRVENGVQIGVGQSCVLRLNPRSNVCRRSDAGDDELLTDLDPCESLD